MLDCLFCKIVAGEIPAQKVYEDETVLAFNDIAPKAPVHVLIIPKRHYENVAGLAEGAPEVLAHLTSSAGKIAASLVPDGGFTLLYNTGASAGQTVFHAHGHILAGEGFANPTAEA